MPRLVIEMDHEFQAGPMEAHDAKSSQCKVLSVNKLNELLRDADPTEFSVSVSFLDPDEGWPCVGFELTRKGLKKGGVFEFTVDEKARLARIAVKGELSSSPLRAGVAPFIQKMGRKADLRLQAFNYKGGEWSGFTAPIIGQKKDDFRNWFRITSWKLR